MSDETKFVGVTEEDLRQERLAKASAWLTAKEKHPPPDSVIGRMRIQDYAAGHAAGMAEMAELQGKVPGGIEDLVKAVGPDIESVASGAYERAPTKRRLLGWALHEDVSVYFEKGMWVARLGGSGGTHRTRYGAMYLLHHAIDGVEGT